MKNLVLIFTSVFVFAGVTFLLHYKVVGSGVWGDGQYYYAYIRSIVVDGDLNFKNELEHFSRQIEYTKTNLVANKYSIGTAILWLPFFLAAQIIVIFFNILGFGIVADGYSHIYQITVGLGSVFYGILGLWFCFRAIGKYFSDKIALTATLGIWLGSNLFFYTAVDPINSHAVSFFAASVVFFLWLKPAELTSYQVAVLGLSTGLLTLVRNQDFIFAIPIFLSLFLSFQALIFLLSTLLGFLPQLLVWQIIYGEPRSPYLISGETFNWLNPKIFEVLFNSTNGLLYYSPIIIFSLLGLYFFSQKNRLLAMNGIFLFLLQTYIVASWYYFTQGASYGGRMFISLMPFFIVGLAALLDKFKAYVKVIYGLLFFLIILNFGMIIKFLLINP